MEQGKEVFLEYKLRHHWIAYIQTLTMYYKCCVFPGPISGRIIFSNLDPFLKSGS